MNKKFLIYIILILSMNASAQIIEPDGSTDPEPHGGWKTLKSMVRDHLEYPQNLLNIEKEGNVLLRFDVLETGEVTELYVVQSSAPEFTTEAIRLFRKVRWNPGTDYKGVRRATQYLEVSFDMSKYRKWVKRRGYDRIPFPYTPIDSTEHLFQPTETDLPPKAVFSDSLQNVQGFINAELKYPEEAYRRSISGKVILTFVIEQSGRITNLRAAQTIGGGCTEEAMRLLKLIKWNPAQHNGKAVRVAMSLDVIFVLPLQVSGGG